MVDDAFTACFDARGVRLVAPGKPDLTLNAVAMGRTQSLRRLHNVKPEILANRVLYRYKGFSEWWNVLPTGLEQEFVIDNRPPGKGHLTLVLKTSRPAREARNAIQVDQVLYGELTAMDAEGRILPSRLTRRGEHILLSVDDTHAEYPLTLDPLVWSEHRLTGGDGAYFGWTVALDGDTALIGSGYTGNGVYVFKRTNGVWSEVQKLEAAESKPGDKYGLSLALHGNTAFVGAPAGSDSGNGEQGAVYVFTESNGSWNETQRLTARNGLNDDHFGYSIALSDSVALIGAPEITEVASQQGAAYVFTKANGTWRQEGQLVANDPGRRDQFGFSVALSGDGNTALIGAIEADVGENTAEGAAYVFRRATSSSGDTWLSETAWPYTGGSPSTFEPMPGWQQGVGQNEGHDTRGVPDIAFDGDPSSGAVIVYYGNLDQIGGTSLSAPLFAGAWARMLAADGSNLGFAAPLLYQLPPADFHDVTQGSNGGENAAPGWDYTSGFGSLILNQVVNDLDSAASRQPDNSAYSSRSASPPLATPRTESYVATKTRGTLLSSGERVIGDLPPDTPLRISLCLKLRNRRQLAEFLGRISRSLLSPRQFESRYSATAQQASRVARYLRLTGFRGVKVTSNRMLVTGRAPASDVEAAFHTRIVRVMEPDGQIGYANLTPAKVPDSLANIILAVLGLQNIHQVHPYARRYLPEKSDAQPDAVVGHNPTEFPAIYGGNGIPTASGVPIGIVAEGDMTYALQDLQDFADRNDLPPISTTVVNTNGTSNDTSNTIEWDLDSQTIVGMAGGQVGQMIFYVIPTLQNSDMTADINTIVEDDATNIINVSLGECETSAQQDGSAAAQDQLFAEAVSQGQTFSVSSGDSGADECGDGGTTPSWPASSQYVVSVGGTTLDVDTSGAWQQSAKLSAAEGGADDEFGFSVGLSGNTAVVGAPFSPKGIGDGSAYVFTASGNSWTESAALHDDTGEQDFFGEDVVLSNGRLLVSAPHQSVHHAYSEGAVYTYTEHNAVWKNDQVLTASDTPHSHGTEFLDFGNSISLSGNAAFVGAQPAASRGAAYFLRPGYHFSLHLGAPSRILSDSSYVSQVIATNSSSVTMPAVSVTLGVPAEATFISAEASQGSCTKHASIVTCNFGEIEGNGGMAQASIDLRAMGSSGDVISNSAVATTVTPDVTAGSPTLIDTPPKASNGSAEGYENTVIYGYLHATDADSDPLTFEIVTPPAHGNVIIQDSKTKTYAYTPDEGYSGVDQFTFRASDGLADSNTATTYLTIIPSGQSGGSGGGGGSLAWYILLAFGLLVLFSGRRAR